MATSDREQTIEEKLRQSEANLAAAQRIAHLGSWELDLDNLHDVNVNPLRWSDECFRIFGYEPGEVDVTNENFFKAVHPDDHALIGNAVRKAIEDGERYSIVHRVVCRDGSIKFVHEQSDIILDTTTGKPKKMVGTVLDITERYKMEEALRAKDEQVRQMQKTEALGRLSGGISHDFNNILSVIMCFAEDVQKALRPWDPVYRKVQEILNAAEKGAGLTRQLQAFSRKQVNSPRVTNLNQIVISIETILRRVLGEDVAMTIFLDPDLFNIRVDSTQMEQVLVNLAVNAREAMLKGGQLRIETANHGDSSVTMTVIDTGTGMDGETLRRAFEPYFTTKENGTGLGLATVQGIVEQSGGRIAVQSEVGHGTKFRIYLPRTDALETPVDEVPHATTAARVGTGTVLLVEDQATLWTIEAEVLREAGYSVLEACNGEDALEQLARAGFPALDIVITDVVMPILGGPELVRKLEPHYRNLRVLFLSGYTRDARIETETEAGGPSFLDKPFTSTVFLSKVKSLVGVPKSN